LCAITSTSQLPIIQECARSVRFLHIPRCYKRLISFLG
jgi:hypothetical protein